MFTKLKQYLSINKSSFLKIAIFFWFYFLLTDLSFADDPGTGAWSTKDNFENAKNAVVTGIQWISTIISVLLWLMTYLTTMFLSPDWTSGTIFGINWYLQKIWILVSNVVYFVFAFILIFIAFANIIWSENANFALKQAIPKFIIWILIVPFSWFIVQFLVSISSILTISAMNLPFEAFKDYESAMSTVSIPKNCTINLPSLWASEWQQKAGTSTDEIFSCSEEHDTLSNIMKTDKSADGVFWIISLYTYWIVWIENFDKLIKKEIPQLKTIWDVVVKVIFDLIFILVYALLMIALGLALMIRWIRLWIFMMFAPLFGLMYFFWKSSWWGWFFEKFNFKEFLGLVMVPVYTMLALSFGLLFIYITGQWLTKPGTEWWQTTASDNTIKINNFELHIEWWIAAPENITKFVKTAWNDTLWIIWALILKIFWIVVLWWTVMAALRSSKITEAIVSPIAEFGKNVWQLATQLPQYAPILPGWQSLKSLQQLPTGIWSYYTGKTSEAQQELMKKLWFSNFNTESLNELKQINSQLAWSWWINSSVTLKWEALKKVISAFKQNNSIVQDSNWRDEANKTMQDYLGRRNFKFEARTRPEDFARELESIKRENSTLASNAGYPSNNYTDIVNYLRENWTVAPAPDNTSWWNTWWAPEPINISINNRQINLPLPWNWQQYQVWDAQAIASQIASWAWLQQGQSIDANTMRTLLINGGISDRAVLDAIINELRNNNFVN